MVLMVSSAHFQFILLLPNMRSANLNEAKLTEKDKEKLLLEIADRKQTRELFKPVSPDAFLKLRYLELVHF